MTRHFKLRAALAVLFAGGAALPAFAQDFCSGLGQGGQWIGGTQEASDISTSGDYLEQMALVLMNSDYVAIFDVTEPTEVRMEAQARGAGDPLFDLYAPNGDIVLSDDDSGGDSASRAETMLEPGTYCLAMSTYDGAPMTGYVRVGRLEHEALTPGLGAMPVELDGGNGSGGDGSGGGITAGAQMPGEICEFDRVVNFFSDGAIDSQLATGLSATASVNDIAYWGFYLDSPQALTITAVNESADPVIALYDGMGNWLAENDDWDGLNSQIDLSYPLDPGPYCIAVTALSDPSLPITVSVVGFDPMAEQVAMFDYAEAAPPLDGSYPVTDLGALDTRLRQDVQNGGIANWFSFDVNEGGLILIEAVTNGLGDPVLVLFDDFGRQVTMNDDYGDSYDSLLAARVLPGKYLVAVRQYDDSAPVMTRLLFERYVPAR
ncbi:ABC transporter substrate-binding protein [Pseudoroseicyclus sp. CXY001]|uniref:ABC transporter substrate-binding protein n=1 Tax=Pseudoroseicyclus sp. CXY001 TaxID=3242492 RepID=UPI003570EA3A